MAWQEQLKQILEKGCTDSDIEDFIDEHPETEDFIWDFVYDYLSPPQCKGCKHVQMDGFPPCNRCSRKIQLKDYYEKR